MEDYRWLEFIGNSALSTKNRNWLIYEDKNMALALSNIKELLKNLRENDWYITAFEFSYNGYEYVVVFEDLREIDRGTKYYAVMLTFIDKNDEGRILETYANSYDFQINDEEIKEYFRIGGNRAFGNPILTLYYELNKMVPTEYAPLKKEYYRTVLEVIDKREHNEGFCCYKARHNGKKANGEQIYRSGKNTAKTKLLRESLFNRIGNDKTISFCYRQENELSDSQIISNLDKK
ncbi:MAG: hypothetical protein K2M81_02975 [Lachnospiraceae bacterium]|nr:hypothetical protein [Lachnospiraceae bacterium]